MKKKVKMILVTLLAILMSYYNYILISTQHIMVDLKRIENGEKITNLAYQLFGESEELNNIKRYFTWCWRNKGTIWITYKYSYIEDDGEIIAKGRDYTKLIIEKKNGKWIAVQTEWEP